MKHLIIWLDGTYGVGKTTIANMLKERFIENNIEVLDSDKYYLDVAKDIMLLGGGCFPQNNIYFINYFKNIIKNKLEKNNMDLIIVMSLTQKECKEMLFEYIVSKYSHLNVLHIILVANKKNLKLRIENDVERDTMTAFVNLDRNIAFLEDNFSNAIKVDTNGRDIVDITDEIFNMCSQTKMLEKM